MTIIHRTPFHKGLFLGEPAAIALMTCIFLALLCVSLFAVSQDVRPIFHIGYDSRYALQAAISVAALTCFIPLFALKRFSFGYLVSFCMLAIISGYLWLSYFTPLEYNHVAARWSAAISFTAFMLPLILITRSTAMAPTMTSSQMDILAICLLAGSALVIAYATHLEFHLVGFVNGEALRTHFNYPVWLNYAIPLSSTALMPFTYAWFELRKRYVLAGMAILVAIATYPVTLNKTTLLAPFWLLAGTLALKIFSQRLVVILSLLAPILLGFAAKILDPTSPEVIFRLINFRMLAVPASGLDHYYHFFSSHPLTHFCQISIVGRLFDCRLPEQLGVTMAKEYALGNYNASLFATEGIASVGVFLAPVVALLCGLALATGNIASAGLKPSFVLLSSSILALVLMNVPLSTTMVTHGGIVTFLLWLVTPREAANTAGQRRPVQKDAKGRSPSLGDFRKLIGPTNVRLLTTGVALAALLSADAIFVVVYGVLGLKGNSTFTGTFLLLSELAILAFSFWSDFRLRLADCLFISFVFCVAISATLNTNVAPMRDWGLLLLTLLAYISCRFTKVDQLDDIRRVFVWVAIPIVAIGTIGAAYTLTLQWNDPHGKPIVLGFDAWAIDFLGVLGLLMLAVVSKKLDVRKTLLISAFIFLPIAIFSASAVRFTFLAILVGLFVTALYSDNRQRVYIAILAAVSIAAITCGLLARPNLTAVLLQYAVEETKERTDVLRSTRETRPASELVSPSCLLDVNAFNSVAIRKGLLRDALFLAPKSGFFGFGLDGFTTLSCIPQTEVHVTILQTVVEFGWMGTLALLGLLGVTTVPLMRRAFANDVYRWLSCWITYEVVTGLAHGRINQEIPMFLMLGIAAAVYERDQKAPT